MEADGILLCESIEISFLSVLSRGNTVHMNYYVTPKKTPKK